MSPRARLLVLAVMAALTALPATAAGATRATQIASFAHPVYATSPPGDPHRVFVVEQAGYVRVVRDGVKLGDPFLDIHSDVRSGGEQGFVSLAFAPDYATSGKFYVYYTAPPPAGAGSVVTVDEFTRSTDPDRADPATRRNVLRIDHSDAVNHNGGQLMFGPDGYLWITTGDGGGGNDRFHNAQNPSALLGKVLRIDPRAANPYAIPSDNPFASPTDGTRDEIWAFGLRNPFRASFDRATGDLTIGDVGESRAEEIDFSPRGTGSGGNFGWSCFEGFQANPSASGACKPDAIEPVLEQGHGSSGFCAIIGGYVVRDPALTDLAGRYVYGDNCQPALRSAVLAKPRASDDRPVGASISGLSSFGEDSCGHVYATSLKGPLYRLDGDQSPSPCPESGAPTGGSRPDTTGPVLRMSRQRVQRILRNNGFVIAVTCDENCGFTSSGVMRVRGSRTRYGLRKVSRMANAGGRTRVRLLLSKRGATALRRTGSASATITVVARDSVGNETIAEVGVRGER
jgi:glucose/arabinose dehydrogenase